MTKEQIYKKREEEKETMKLMVQVYCRGKHGHKKDLCSDCQKLMEYSFARTDHCPFMETKTFCSACKVHCYAPQMRTAVKEVMRYSGPRMLLYHPGKAIKHMGVTIKKKIKAKD